MNRPGAMDGTIAAGSGARPFDVIASLDLLGGNVVRLRQGAFDDVTVYGEPEAVLERLAIPAGARLHLVDLEGSRSGRPMELNTVARLRDRGHQLQVGGGIRSAADARRWIDAGAQRVVVGTLAADAPEEFARIVEAVGSARVIAAIDLRDGRIRVEGWTAEARRDLPTVLRDVERHGIGEILVTDIGRDGMLAGPSFGLYRNLGTLTSLRILASGGVATLGDIVSLARMPNVGGAIVGRALLDARLSYERAVARAALRDALPERVIPCLDVRDGRVVKGVRFEGIRDAGDPVECARRYEAEGADELIILDISATDRGRQTALETVHRVAEALFIPLAVGGGVRSVGDFRSLLRAGADRVTINTAAIRDPQLIAECAREFGVQAVVLSCDAKRSGSRRARGGSKRVVPSLSEESGGRGTTSRHSRRHRAARPPDPSLTLGMTGPRFEAMVRSGKESRGTTGRNSKPHRAAQPPDPSLMLGMTGPRFEAMIRSGKESNGVEVISWCRKAEELGAGEILLTSVDRDGTGAGFDLELLRAVSSVLSIGVIASGGAGTLDHFRDAIEIGGARAVLAASLFHDRKLTIQQVKETLAAANIPVRTPMETNR